MTDHPEETRKEVLTAGELAEYLGFSKNWIYRKAEAGEIPGVKLGNRWRFKRSVIDRWLEGQILRRWGTITGEGAEGEVVELAEGLPPEAAELLSRVYEVIREHPEGVTLERIGEELGLGWRGLTSYIRRLIDEGKVRKEGKEYFPR